MADEKEQPSSDKASEDMEKQITELKAQCDEYLNGWKRAKADYINFKKETESKQQMLFEFANAALLMEILPIYDNLKKAIALIGDEKNNWIEGIKQIKKQFEDLLKDYGIEGIKTVGEKFNPEFHEAVSREKKESVEPGIIISEAGAGYLMKSKVLVPAKVIVAE